MKTKKNPKETNGIPPDAVLLIPEPENEGEPPAYGVRPGYYNHKEMLELLNQHKGDAGAIRFIADMLETGVPEDDGFADMIRDNCANPMAIQRIIQICES